MLGWSRRLKGNLAIVIASFLWGTTGTAASYSLNVSPLAVGAFAMGASGILLVLTNINVLLISYREIFKQRTVFVFGVLSIAIYPLAFYSSMSLSGVAIGTIVSLASAPLFAVLLERFFSKKTISKQWLISFVIGVSGIVLLTEGKEYAVENSKNQFINFLGVTFGCIAGLTYACYSWTARSFIEKGINSRAALSSLFGGATFILLPSLWFTGDNLFLNISNSFVSMYIAIIPMFLGYLLFSYGLKFIDTSHATLITLIEPLVATILAVLILGESFKPTGWLGGVMVCCCFIIQSDNPIFDICLNKFRLNKFY